MKILFTGFTSRTIGSDRNVYDYMSNVNVLIKTLELAGHEVDVRPVDITTDPVIEEDYDCALVGVAALQGLSSRFKLGALWTLSRFGRRAAIFPSDGRNVATFPSSVKTCLTGSHGDRTPYEYFLYGQFPKEKSNVVGVELAEVPEIQAAIVATMARLPHNEASPHCDWPVLVPTHSWGNPTIYARHFGAPVTVWDPTRVAIPMQFTLENGASMLCPDTGQLPGAAFPTERKREWILSTLQDQDPWLKKQNCKWPVISIGNKRKASKGEGLPYLPELDMINQYYTRYWGHLAFGYPLADGGWWRMRYIHAALAGIVTCTDQNDARRMPEAFQHSRIMLERWSDEKLAQVARDQYDQLMESAWPSDKAVSTVDSFVKGLA